MTSTENQVPTSAIVVGHPGHELRLFHWISRARPLTFVLTDGSGGGSSRIASSRELADRIGATAGPVFGAFTDAQLYDLLMRGDVTPVIAATRSIASAFVDRGVKMVVSDAFEFYNPTHDLCAVVTSLAARLASADSGNEIELYDYAVTQTAGDGVVFNLDPVQVEEKIAAAHRFDQLSKEVDTLVSTVGDDDLRREVLRPIAALFELPRIAGKPFYETHGEKRVKSGRYSFVLRYEEHFVPYVLALAAAVGHPIAEPARAQA
jgi:hypothetical protein